MNYNEFLNLCHNPEKYLKDGMICYKAGGICTDIKEIIVTKDNKEEIIKSWNECYFLTYEGAENKTQENKKNYREWQSKNWNENF